MLAFEPVREIVLGACSLTEWMVKAADALVTSKEHPHVDVGERSMDAGIDQVLTSKRTEVLTQTSSSRSGRPGIAGLPSRNQHLIPALRDAPPA